MTHRFNDDGTFTPDYWAAKAEEAEAIAEEMVHRRAKATMRAIAQSYHILAQQARELQQQRETLAKHKQPPNGQEDQ